MINQRMPALFLGHGNPMHAIQENYYTEQWAMLGASLPHPKAIIAISAHWYTPGTAVTAMDYPKTIHDFGNFPEELFKVQYPAPGAPELAKKISTLVPEAEIALDYDWGLDHGTWGVLIKMYPEADIPVIQLSINAAASPNWHFQLGQKLSQLRDQGVMIVGSGNTVHNLAAARWGESGGVYAWAEDFDHYVQQQAPIWHEQGNPLIKFMSHPLAQQANPTPEHFLPLLYILGAARADDQITIPIKGMDMGSISMTSFLVNSPEQ